LEQVQHFHFLCAIFLESQNMGNFAKISKPQFEKKENFKQALTYIITSFTKKICCRSNMFM
jgi:hypothetical protein